MTENPRGLSKPAQQSPSVTRWDPPHQYVLVSGKYQGRGSPYEPARNQNGSLALRKHGFMNVH
ncbi:hypothetical protein DPMN_028191 [Dreissena polymorpha]|uniref:Uncharacterized protein n=1 Tax=Dreissena polymorpha TaxID=45954 RepID=A0A9D4LWS9_DREPO|nr:hypothetical protein DPMN_028191 [Dreissena polymorpha]